MKRKTLFVLAIMVAVSSFSLFAQKSTRQERRAARAEQQKIEQQKLLSAIASKNFNFTANQITYTLNPMIQNITLNQYYGITLSPDKIEVSLPLYGANNFNNMPTLFRKLYFVAYTYKYSVEPLKNGGATVTIRVMDPWNMNNYIFTLNTTNDGDGTTLSSTTPFTSPVNYIGTLELN